MEEILACRACLATDTKLFDMYKYHLVSAYETLTGTQVTAENMPQSICSICSALLMKCASFQEKCRSAQRLLNFAVMDQHLITTDYIRTIDRDAHNLTFPYSATNICTIEEIKYVETDVKTNITEEKSSSDEEPLSKIVKKHKKRKKKIKLHTEFHNVQIKDESDGQADESIDFLDDIAYVDRSIDKDSKQFEPEDVDIINLTKDEQLAEIQARKESVNYKNSFYKCNFCYKGFMTDVTFKNHMVKHDPSFGPHVCPVCQVRWADKRSLGAHLASAHARRYSCRRCGHVSKSSHRAREHLRWHDGMTYDCEICGASFSKSTSHLTHMRLQHPSGHQCRICGASFLGQYGLNMHAKKAHRGTENSDIKVETKCLCGIFFKSPEALERHLSYSKENTCDTNFRWCVFCGDSFSSEELLKDHQKLHQKDETVKCSECNRVFAHARSLAAHHQRVHLGVRRGPRAARSDLVCELCGQRCLSKATLVYHQRTHTGEKPYQCSECPKRFSIFQRLQIHLRTHTGERPFKCAHCPKAFKHKAALNRHDRVHTGAKPYGCPHCGKAFSQSNSMKTHVKTVHLKLPAPYRKSHKKEIYPE